MSEPGSSNTADNPIIFRSNNKMYIWFAILAAFFTFALVRGYLAASTTGERIEAIIVCGVPTGLFVLIVVYMLTRNATISVSAGKIAFTKPAKRGTTSTRVLDRSSGNDLTVITTFRLGQEYVTGLTINGSGTTLPLETFDVVGVRRACIAKGWGWHVPAPGRPVS